MKALLLTLVLATTAAVFAQQPKNPKPGDGGPAAYLFRDPYRKVKKPDGELVNADLRPIFAWYQHRHGKRPMEVWARAGVTVVETHATGVLVSNDLDQKVFFLRNYPHKVPPKTVMQVFSIDDGFYSYKDKNGNKQTVHAFDYGVPYNPASEKKATPEKKSTSSVKPADAAAKPVAK